MAAAADEVDVPEHIDMGGVTEVVEMGDDIVARAVEHVVSEAVATILAGQGFSVCRRAIGGDRYMHCI